VEKKETAALQVRSRRSEAPLPAEIETPGPRSRRSLPAAGGKPAPGPASKKDSAKKAAAEAPAARPTRGHPAKAGPKGQDKSAHGGKSMQPQVVVRCPILSSSVSAVKFSANFLLPKNVPDPQAHIWNYLAFLFSGIFTVGIYKITD
jgi:hypothetical protein